MASLRGSSLSFLFNQEKQLLHRFPLGRDAEMQSELKIQDGPGLLANGLDPVLVFWFDEEAAGSSC